MNCYVKTVQCLPFWAWHRSTFFHTLPIIYRSLHSQIVEGSLESFIILTGISSFSPWHLLLLLFAVDTNNHTSFIFTCSLDKFWLMHILQHWFHYCNNTLATLLSKARNTLVIHYFIPPASTLMFFSITLKLLLIEVSSSCTDVFFNSLNIKNINLPHLNN